MLKKVVLLDIFVDTVMLKEKLLLEMEIFCNIINVTFKQYMLATKKY